MRNELLTGIVTSICLVIMLTSCKVIIENRHAFEEQGPGPIINGQCEGIENRAISGAISSALPDPDDANTILIGAVNGGIWKTRNALSSSPVWRPVNDQLPSLSISCMLRDRFNTNLIYAGIGNQSSFKRVGGPLKGILKSTDRGNTWRSISTSLNGLNIFKIAVGLYNQNSNGNRSIYAATNQGLFKSTDETAFNVIASIPAITVSDVFSDHKGQIIIAAVPGDSVYISQDYGVSFRGLKINLASAFNIKLSVAANTLFIAESRSNSTRAFIYVVSLLDINDIRNLDGPTTQEGSVSKGPFNRPNQSFIHFSFLAHKFNDGAIYLFLGGVSNEDLVFGSTVQSTYSARIFKGVYDLNNIINWTPIVGNGANQTAPHADSRNLSIDKDGNLIEVDDGGIYKMAGADFLYNNRRKWKSLNSNLRISEVTSVAWDSKNNALIAGLQDCGSVEQTVSAFSNGEKKWTDARLFTLLGLDIVHAVGDGFSVNVDNQHDPPIRYTMLNSLNSLNKREYSELEPDFVGAPWDQFLFNNGCAITNCALDMADQQDIENNNAAFIPFELNAIDQKKFVIGAKAIYRFDNRGDDLKIVDTRNTTARTQCIAYGATNLPEVVYYAKSGDTVISQQKEIDGSWIRKPFKNVFDIAIDKDTANNIFCITSNEVLNIRKFSSNTMTSHSIVYNLNLLLAKPQSWSVISMFKVKTAGNNGRLVLIGCQGGVFMLSNFRGRLSWIRLGLGLPNVPISEIRYFEEDDILTVGTFGRGVWVMKDLSQKIPRQTYRLLGNR